MLGFLSVIFFIIGFASAYVLWLRPLLRSRPSFAEFYARTDSFWRALWLKMAFLKTKLVAGLLMVASGLVGLHDFVPVIAAGIDWEPLTSKVPSWAWPIASFSLAAVFYWLRSVTAHEHEMVIAQVQDGVPVAQAVMLVATEPTSNLPTPDLMKGD